MSLDPVSAILDVGSKVIDRLWPDPAAAQAAKIELFKMQQSGELAVMANDTQLAKIQGDINTEEAKNSNVFVAGWRPFVGWICGLTIGFKYIGGPLLAMLTQLTGHPVTLPIIDAGELWPILMGMLGLGGMRTVEKLGGVSTSK